MNKSLVFYGRDRLIAQLARLYSKRTHIYLLGEAGMGKTALLRQMRQRHSMLICEESSSLRRICDSLERQLGWTHYKLNVIERKNRLLAYLARRGEPVAFRHVSHATSGKWPMPCQCGSHVARPNRMQSDICGRNATDSKR
jgi:ABC-type phosphate/phosphonate transport system ATPase subunit